MGVPGRPPDRADDRRGKRSRKSGIGWSLSLARESGRKGCSVARIRSADEVNRRPVEPIRGPPAPRDGPDGVSEPLPEGLRNGGRSGAGPRRAGWPVRGRSAGRPGAGRLGAGRPGAGRLGAGRPGAADAGAEGRGAAPDAPAATPGCGLRAPEEAGGRASGAEAAGRAAPAGETGFGCVGAAPEAAFCAPACAWPGFTAGAAEADEPGRGAGGRRFTTTGRRCFFTTTMRRRSSPAPVAGRPDPAPEADTGAVPAGLSSALGGAGATTFGSGLRLIRVARGRGFSSVSGRSEEDFEEGVVCSSLILNKYNSVRARPRYASSVGTQQRQPPAR